MSSQVFGCITVELPESVVLPEEAGSMSARDMQRMPKPRGDLNVTADEVLSALTSAADQFMGCGVDAETLQQANNASRDIDRVVADLRLAVQTLEQSNTVLDAKVHEMLRQVLAHVNARKKFDASITTRVPRLAEYFMPNG